MTTLLNFSLSADSGDFGVGGGATEVTPITASSAPAEGIQMVCEQTPQEMQAGGEFWNFNVGSGPPVDLPLREFAPNSLADPIRGPSGDRSNLTPPGPVGAWCRPPPLPFADSSPLASRVFWASIAFVLVHFRVLAEPGFQAAALRAHIICRQGQFLLRSSLDDHGLNDSGCDVHQAHRKEIEHKLEPPL
jgi:hypothetical protein